jgi:hypothetical protein
MQEWNPKATASKYDQPHTAHTACHIRPQPWLHRPGRR